MLIARLIADAATRETRLDALAVALRAEGASLATADVLADGEVLERVVVPLWLFVGGQEFFAQPGRRVQALSGMSLQTRPSSSPTRAS